MGFSTMFWYGSVSPDDSYCFDPAETGNGQDGQEQGWEDQQK